MPCMNNSRVGAEGTGPTGPSSCCGLSTCAVVVIVVAVVVAVAVLAAVIAVAVILTMQPPEKVDEDFVCDDGTELPADRQCDGYMECEDGEDEEDCDCDQDFDHKSECSSDGTCMWEDWFCDGTSDCSEGEDELSCGLSCSGSEFECADHTQCIAVAARCDQTTDCTDGSDEWDCLTIDYYSGQPVLLVLHEASYVPVCNSNWDGGWINDVCEEMGFGSGSAHGTLAAASVTESSGGYMNPTGGGSITDSALDVLTYSATCASNLVVTLTCAYDECGSRGEGISHLTGQERIIQGFRAQNGAWPWQIAVQFLDSQICGGSLIAPNWVVTAAHCIEYEDYPTVYSVRAGSTKVSGSDTDLQTSETDELFVHEDYDASLLLNDIALIKLVSPMTYTDYVRHVCVPDEDEDWSESVVCYTSGWGAWVATASRYPDKLQEVKLPMIDATHCSSLVDLYNDTASVCAGYPSGDISVCSGDSGGPLVCRDKRNVWTLAGVTSYVIGTTAEPCGSVSVFARVTTYSTWIADTIADNS